MQFNEYIHDANSCSGGVMRRRRRLVCSPSFNLRELQKTLTLASSCEDDQWDVVSWPLPINCSRPREILNFLFPSLASLRLSSFERFDHLTWNDDSQPWTTRHRNEEEKHIWWFECCFSRIWIIFFWWVCGLVTGWPLCQFVAEISPLELNLLGGYGFWRYVCHWCSLCSISL